MKQQTYNVRQQESNSNLRYNFSLQAAVRACCLATCLAFRRGRQGALQPAWLAAPPGCRAFQCQLLHHELRQRSCASQRAPAQQSTGCSARLPAAGSEQLAGARGAWRPEGASRRNLQSRRRWGSAQHVGPRAWPCRPRSSAGRQRAAPARGAAAALKQRGALIALTRDVVGDFEALGL